MKDDEVSAQEAAEQAQYGAAFGELGQPEPGEDSNPAMGIEMPEDAEAEGAPGAAESGNLESEVAADPGQAVMSEAAGEASDEGAEADPAAVAQAPAGKEEQRLKSWEGRLKKMEAELNQRQLNNPAELAEQFENAAEQATSSGNPELGAAAQQAATQIEDGSISAEQAMKQLSEDFGADFVKLIETVVSAKAAEVGHRAANESMAPVNERMQSIISHIKDDTERNHFERIAEAFPDFDEIRQSPDFMKFIQAGGASRQSVADGGGTREVLRLLKDYKAQAARSASPTAGPKPVSQGSVDAASGVRSRAMSLPAEPVGAEDFAGAWNEATKG